jgi:hypothetical protein
MSIIYNNLRMNIGKVFLNSGKMVNFEITFDSLFRSLETLFFSYPAVLKNKINKQKQYDFVTTFYSKEPCIDLEKEKNMAESLTNIINKNVAENL